MISAPNMARQQEAGIADDTPLPEGSEPVLPTRRQLPVSPLYALWARGTLMVSNRDGFRLMPPLQCFPGDLGRTTQAPSSTRPSKAVFSREALRYAAVSNT